MAAFNQPASLPLDVVELVLAEVASDNDMATLKNCSLASSVLLPMCRKYIFSKVELDSTVDHSGACQVRQFKRLLDHDPSIANYIRALDYTGVCDSKPAPPVLKHLRRVTSFTFGFRSSGYNLGGTQEWKTIPSALKNSLATFIRYNKLTTLHLFRIQSVPAALFNCFPHLRKLVLYCVTISNISLYGKFFKAKKAPKLVSLFIKNSNVGPLIKLPAKGVQMSEPMLDLTSLEKFECGVDEDPTVMNIVRPILKVAESLRCLALSGSHPDIDFLGVFSSDINHRSLETLKTVRLHPMIETQEEDPYLNLTAELEQIAGKNVVEDIVLCISIETDRRCTTDASRWNQLDRVLSQGGGFPFLQSVEIKVIVYHWSREVADFQSRLEEIRVSCFPWLRGNKDVEFSFEVAIEDV
ncbi:hypothetical protein CPB84DRAFT_1771189 [Gymnopilus junonius]|uniref:F-box protein n=1 Tax=Gymnopilus junonius TaxID=109634 RepID=A0A9P5NT62_GYMJU|nr:hypothetical protein CPB84DRAFT_1771189 [Gymnopilus junonius]